MVLFSYLYQWPFSLQKKMRASGTTEWHLPCCLETLRVWIPVTPQQCMARCQGGKIDSALWMGGACVLFPCQSQQHTELWAHVYRRGYIKLFFVFYYAALADSRHLSGSASLPSPLGCSCNVVVDLDTFFLFFLSFYMNCNYHPHSVEGSPFSCWCPFLKVICELGYDRTQNPKANFERLGLVELKRSKIKQSAKFRLCGLIRFVLNVTCLARL